jgi:ATP-dependent DNA helicase RecQ
LAVAAEDDRRVQIDRSRVEMMRGYAELTDCRRRYLLNYFGETADELCGNCDNCDAGLGRAEDAHEEPWEMGDRVTHARFGPGQVVRYEGDRIVVLFDRVGYGTLSVEMLTAADLLRDSDG